MTVRTTIGAALVGLPPRLSKHSDTPELDAQVLLAHLLGKPRSWVLAHTEAPLTRERCTALEGLAARLEAGEPLPYVLGRWEFFGLDFELTPDVLIPRPESELLVEQALAWLAAKPDMGRPPRAVDIGTGSGCLAVTLAMRAPGVRVAATDLSPAALEVARRNAVRHAVAERIEFSCCDLFPGPSGDFDLVLANLPYIPTRLLQKLPVFMREPTLALDGGGDGLRIIRRLLTEAPDRMAPGGLLLLEIASGQGPSVLSLACDSFTQAEIHLHKDLAGHDRLVEVQV
jgi:release factor glutamine methyltransferase